MVGISLAAKRVVAYDTPFPILQSIIEILGGKPVMRRLIRNGLEAHDRIVEGLPVCALIKLIKGLNDIPIPVVIATLGMSERTFRRRAKAAEQDPSTKLSPEESSNLWRLAELFALARATLGSRETAVHWFRLSQLGLSGRRPIELARTSPGAELIKGLLVRIEYGVYT